MRSLKGIILFTALPFLFLSLKAQVTWDGSEDSDWENNDNWDTGLYPDYSEDAIIPSGMPFDPVIQSSQGSPVECNNLTIDPGVTLTIIQDGGLNIYGDVNNSGDIIIEDNGIFWQDIGSTYTGQAGSTFTLSRTGTSDALKFNMWSSPVSGQSVSAFSGNAYSFNPATSTASTADDDNDPGWSTASGTMTVGKGYGCAGCGTVTFSGTPNNGSFSTAVAYPIGGVPYNLIGNPYPSPLDISSFLGFGGNPTDLATQAVYLWDNPPAEPWDQADYATVNSAGSVSDGNGTYSTPYEVIPTGQGFFVEIDAATDNDLDFDNSVRGDGFVNNSQFYKQAAMQRLWLGIADKDSVIYNELLVAFTDSATTGFDKKYDAKKLARTSRLSLYSVANGRYYAIQGLPYLTDPEAEVPIGVSMDNSNVITFSLKWEELLDNYDIYLKDNSTGSLADLRNDDYAVALDSGAHDERFSIILAAKASTGIDELANDGLSITYNNGIISIMNPENEPNKVEHIRIFDLAGKKINEWNDVQLKANEVCSFSFEPATSGYYIVDAMTGFKSVPQKICVID